MKMKTARLASVCVSLIMVSLMFTGGNYAAINPETLVGMWLFDEGEGNVESMAYAKRILNR